MSFHIIGLPAEPIAPPLELSDRLSAGDERHAVDPPYRTRFASYIRSRETTHGRFEVIEQWRIRLLAVHAFDVHGKLLGSELVEGQYLEAAIERLLADPNAQYLHIHYTYPGRYAATIERGRADDR
jgi:hypothetical protein